MDEKPMSRLKKGNSRLTGAAGTSLMQMTAGDIDSIMVISWLRALRALEVQRENPNDKVTAVRNRAAWNCVS